MTTLTDVPPAAVAYAPPGRADPGRPFLPLLALLFIGSGCAALIYEIVWLQLLQLVIGASAISLGVLLGTFMGGMCVGSLLLSKLVSRSRHPLRVYAILEILIGLCGLAVLFAVPRLGDLYTHFATPGASSVIFRALIASACLLPPTLLMGATLPAIARYVEASPRGVSWLGFFYGGNIVGAVFGCLLAGFYLLRVHDMPTATYIAFGINLAVACLALGLSIVAPHNAPATDTKAAPADAPIALAGEQGPAILIYLVIGLSGLTGLGAEVVWTRLLSLMLGATVYTFSIILAVFLLGLGVGSTAGAAIARSTRRPRTALAACQLILALTIAWAAYAVGRSLPFWPVDPSITVSPWVNFQLDLARALWTVLPAAIFWGASFPIALAAVPSRRNLDPGALVGRVYAANTVGAIIGSLAFSVLVIPHIGTLHAQQLLIGLCIASAVFAMLPLFNPLPSPGRAIGAFAMTALAAAAAIFCLISIPGVPWAAVAFGRYSSTWLRQLSPAQLTEEELAAVLRVNEAGYPMMLDKQGQLAFVHANANPDRTLETYIRDHHDALLSALHKQDAAGQQLDEDVPVSTLTYTGETPDRYCTFIGEGMNVSVAITYAPRHDGSTNPDGSPTTFRYFHGAGKVQASSDPPDMRLQRSLGHLTALVHGNPKDVLVVACGAGVTAGSFVPYDSVKNITICDIEPMVPSQVTPYFWKENHNVVGGDPSETADQKAARLNRVHVVLDDGRHFVRTTKEKFDVITSDPIDPWVKGCAALNTVEYYQMCKDHLKPGGVMALWIPLYENNSESAKSIIATFFQVFPHGILWSNDITKGQGYDAVLFGTPEAHPINVDEMEKFIESHPAVKKSLTDVGFGAPDSANPETSGNVAVDLLASFAADADHIKPWTNGAQLNEDRNLRLQYLSGMWLNKQMAPQILNEILDCYAFPEDIFKGSPESLRALKMELLSRRRIPKDVRPLAQ
jgi:predicted membrane-bound spermidine synthase